ncbi:DUF4189 domain-containing protein [Aurantimonas sp. VKM B-3413]|uniref:DUF4189 domain-containing protein n=1 Tax=Aurantimonas sp. VKM B-3413 TaxID=2779401 RepID=UPI001E36BC5C|nr:DUF4189 domain-containing protein [Aurantimonas sp. VKM B-3413]MCB8836525.1 DUF4189 domain-containing protein [Aurantimonas sp. VKM B-3413]
MTTSLLSRLAICALISVLAGPALAAGAIAVDDEEGMKAGDVGYGTATGYSSREAAAAAALKNCQDEGNSACKVVVRFDTCGAYAGSADYYGIGYGKSEKAAESAALKECGNKSCKIVVSDCE